jgi:hypothetical protein
MADGTTMQQNLTGTRPEIFDVAVVLSDPPYFGAKNARTC